MPSAAAGAADRGGPTRKVCARSRPRPSAAFRLQKLEGRGPGAAFSPDILTDDRTRMWLGSEKTAGQHRGDLCRGGNQQRHACATVPEARKRGYGAALTLRASLADPELPALLIATDEGIPVYERTGYTFLFRFTIWSRSRPARTGSDCDRTLAAILRISSLLARLQPYSYALPLHEGEGGRRPGEGCFQLWRGFVSSLGF